MVVHPLLRIKHIKYCLYKTIYSILTSLDINDVDTRLSKSKYLTEIFSPSNIRLTNNKQNKDLKSV